MSRRIEAICDTIAFANGYKEPESRAYELRNPGLLKDPMNGQTRKYSSHWAGYRSLFEYVQKYCREHPEIRVGAMLSTFHVEKFKQDDAIDFMSRCTNCTVTEQTNLSWFLVEDAVTANSR